ncbi:MAG: hypothetical protein IJW98_04155 [Clostridia bacterium]|nr:hypothetical protein [Clostridia bacterium]
MMKSRIGFIVLSIVFIVCILGIAFIVCVLGAGEEANQTTTTTTTTVESVFKIRRPSPEQDELLTMERITDAHSSVDFVYVGYNSFEELIEHIDNPIRKPTIIRVSVVDEKVGTTPIDEFWPFYQTEVHCRVEEVYYAPENIDLKIGSTNVIIKEYRGMIDGKMWYFKGDLPTLDCYEYYLIGYFSEAQEQYVFSYFCDPIPVVDCYEQYEETMNHYGFDIIDCSSITSNMSFILRDYIAGCKKWLENDDNLKVLLDRLADDDNDRYWQTIVDKDRKDLITRELADLITPGGSVRDIIEVLGKPQSVEVSGGNSIIYHLSEDGAETLTIGYDYLDSLETATVIKRNYVAGVDPSAVENVQIGMNYEEVVAIMGIPELIRSPISGFEPCMEYELSDSTYAIIYLDYSQSKPTVISIRIV